MERMILVFACIFSMCVKAPEHVRVSDKSVESFAETIKTDDLQVLAIGGFYQDKKVESLYLDLDYKKPLTSKLAKVRLMQYVRGMLSHVNKDDELRPFLIKNRLSSKDISLSLGYTSEKGISSQVHLYEGKIVFSTYDKKTNQLNKTHSETLSLE